MTCTKCKVGNVKIHVCHEHNAVYTQTKSGDWIIDNSEYVKNTTNLSGKCNNCGAEYVVNTNIPQMNVTSIIELKLKFMIQEK